MDEYTGSCRVLTLHSGKRTFKFAFEQEEYNAIILHIQWTKDKVPVFKVVAIGDHFNIKERDCSDVLSSLYIQSFDEKTRTMDIIVDQFHKRKIYVLCKWPPQQTPSVKAIEAWKLL